MRRRARKPFWQVKIARERIAILLKLAEQELKKHPERSRRYVELARRIALRYNVRLKKLKRKFCKQCNTLLKPGFTSQVKINTKTKTVVVKCLKCEKLYRYPYK